MNAVNVAKQAVKYVNELYQLQFYFHINSIYVLDLWLVNDHISVSKPFRCEEPCLDEISSKVVMW